MTSSAAMSTGGLFICFAEVSAPAMRLAPGRWCISSGLMVRQRNALSVSTLLLSLLSRVVMLRPCRQARRMTTSNARASFGGGAWGGAMSLSIFLAAARVTA